MYGLPADFDPQVFVGRQLTSLTFSQFLIHVNFDEELTVTVLDTIAYRGDSQSEETVESRPWATTSLLSLLGQQVNSGKVESGELVIGLEGGGQMRFADTLANYESFIISIGDTEIIV